MKLTFAAVLGLCLAAAPAFAQQAPAGDAVAGEAMFKQRCALCHMDEADSAPSVTQVKALDAPVILEKLTTGSMAPMAAGLTDADKANIVAYLKAPAK